MAKASSPNSPGSWIVRTFNADTVGVGVELAEFPSATPGGQTCYTAAAFWHSAGVTVPHAGVYDSASSAVSDAMIRLEAASGRRIEKETPDDERKLEAASLAMLVREARLNPFMAARIVLVFGTLLIQAGGGSFIVGVLERVLRERGNNPPHDPARDN